MRAIYLQTDLSLPYLASVSVVGAIHAWREPRGVLGKLLLTRLRLRVHVLLLLLLLLLLHLLGHLVIGRLRLIRRPRLLLLRLLRRSVLYSKFCHMVDIKTHYEGAPFNRGVRTAASVD